MALQFPPNPNTGDTYSSGSSATYEWNGTYWASVQPSSIEVVTARNAFTASYVVGGGSTNVSAYLSSSWTGSTTSTFAGTSSKADLLTMMSTSSKTLQYKVSTVYGSSVVASSPNGLAYYSSGFTGSFDDIANFQYSSMEYYSGSLYATYNHRIYKANLNNRTVEVFAGNNSSSVNSTFGVDDGFGPSKPTPNVRGLRADDDGFLYFIDGNTLATTGRIRKINFATQMITTLAGIGTGGSTTDGTGSAASFSGSVFLETDTNYVYVADRSNNRVRRVGKIAGDTLTIGGNALTGETDNFGTNAQFTTPSALSFVDPQKRYLYVVGGSKLRIIDLATSSSLNMFAITSSTVNLNVGVVQNLTSNKSGSLYFFKNGGFYKIDTAGDPLLTISSSLSQSVAGLIGYATNTVPVDDFGVSSSFYSPSWTTATCYNDGLVYFNNAIEYRVRSIDISNQYNETYYGFDKENPNYKLDIDGSINATGVRTNNILLQSDVNIKRDIQDLSNSEKIFDLNPVTYHLKADESNQTHYGLIAQEVEKVFPELVATGPDGIKSVNYLELIPLILKEFKLLKDSVNK